MGYYMWAPRGCQSTIDHSHESPGVRATSHGPKKTTLTRCTDSLKWLASLFQALSYTSFNRRLPSENMIRNDPALAAFLRGMLSFDAYEGDCSSNEQLRLCRQEGWVHVEALSKKNPVWGSTFETLTFCISLQTPRQKNRISAAQHRLSLQQIPISRRVSIRRITRFQKSMSSFWWGQTELRGLKKARWVVVSWWVLPLMLRSLGS